MLIIESVDKANNENTDRLVAQALEMGDGPGKFEGESYITRYFWLRMMDGDGDLIYSNEFSGESWTLLDVNEYERRLFDWSEGIVAFEIYESSRGFVSGRNLTEDEETKANKTAESLYEQERALSENPDDSI